MDEAALVEDKFQDEPNDQQTRPGDPHFRSLPVRSARPEEVLSLHKLGSNAWGNREAKEIPSTNFRVRDCEENLNMDYWKTVTHARRV